MYQSFKFHPIMKTMGNNNHKTDIFENLFGCHGKRFQIFLDFIAL